MIPPEREDGIKGQSSELGLLWQLRIRNFKKVLILKIFSQFEKTGKNCANNAALYSYFMDMSFVQVGFLGRENYSTSLQAEGPV